MSILRIEGGSLYGLIRTASLPNISSLNFKVQAVLVIFHTIVDESLIFHIPSALALPLEYTILPSHWKLRVPQLLDPSLNQ